MKIGLRSRDALLAFAAMFSLASGAAQAQYNGYQDFGSPGQDGIYERVITISPTARWVNVSRDETIKFVDAASGKSFVWYFNTPAQKIDLDKVAPPGFLAGRHVEAYIGYSQRELSHTTN